MNVFLGNLVDADHVSAQIVGPDGNFLNESFRQKIVNQQEKVTMKTKISGHKTWTAETPNLYTVRVSLMKGHEEIHRIEQRFGFRTIEHRIGDGIYINGQKIKFKGVCRHAFWPDSGRTTSPEVSFNDARLMKEMNMNAVRMSHYPPDVHFLQACDQLGLYVLDELAGWWGHYDTEVGRKLVKEMMKRDINHPSVIFWDNGNESGWNFELDDEFAKYDPQGRTVIHPYANCKPPNPFNNINTDHYRLYGDLKELLAGSTIVMPTELLHGLYDGGHGAGLNDYWKLMWNSPISAGCFLWVFADEGAVRTDRDGQIDTFGNQAPDGIVGPYRQKEGSFFTIKEIWSPIYIRLRELPPDFQGRFEIENRYDFTNLEQCRFEWKLVSFPGPDSVKTGYFVNHSGRQKAPSIAPHRQGALSISLPRNWKQSDAIYLTAIDPDNRGIWTWSWSIKKPVNYKEAIVKTSPGSVLAEEDNEHVTVRAGKSELTFSKNSAELVNVKRNGRVISLGRGPRLVPTKPFDDDNSSLRHYQDGGNYLLEIKDTGGFDFLKWTIYGSGWVRLDYQYSASGNLDYTGITFDYPQKVKAKKWLGQGPYRVWKNRLKGTTLNVWSNQYNDTTPGKSWDYPEFKGYFANLHWVRLETTEGSITAVTDTENLFFRVLTPKNGDEPLKSVMRFPPGNISFLHSIPAVGTKFAPAKSLGPESQQMSASGSYKGTIYFQFTEG
ncbi:glycoside hydrolase family 2 TIM barrel-domain containing protein [Planctomycetota bacterium]